MALLADDEIPPPPPPPKNPAPESAPVAAAAGAADVSMTETDLLDSAADRVLDETMGAGTAASAAAANDTTQGTFDKIWKDTEEQEQGQAPESSGGSVVSGAAAGSVAGAGTNDTTAVDEDAVTEISGNTGRQAGIASVAASSVAASSVAAGSEIPQEAALAEIRDGDDGFERVEEGRSSNVGDTSSYGYGDDEDDDEPATNKGAVSNSYKKDKGGAGRCGRRTIVLAVLGVLIIAAAIAIGACVGAGVLGSGGAPKQASSGGDGGSGSDEPMNTMSLEPTVEGGTRTPTTARPTRTPTRAPVVGGARYELGADFDAAAALSGEEAVSTPGTPQHEALKWLVDVDPMRLTTDAAEAAAAGSGLKLVDTEKFLQRYALTTVIFALTDGEQSGDGMGLVVDEEGDVPEDEEEEEEEEVAVPEFMEEEEEEEVAVEENNTVQQQVDDKEAAEKAAEEAKWEAEQAAKEAQEAAKQAAKEAEWAEWEAEQAAKEAEKAAKEAAKQKEKEEKDNQKDQEFAGPGQQANERFQEDDNTASQGVWQPPFPAEGGDGRRQRRHRRTMAAELLPAGIDECDLKAITCNKDGMVTKINFRNMGLTGTLSPEISQFWQTLTRLDLSDNQLHGPLPDTIYDLYWLEGLFLKSNRFTGTISSKIEQLTSLIHLYAGENNFSGEVTTGFVGCKNIRNLSLYMNNFSGPIPDWTRLNGLFMLDLGFNKMTGTLTESLGNHRTLRLLYLNNNQLTGTIPESYPQIGTRKLKEIHLNNNQLTGEMPSDWSNGFDYQKHLLAIRVENNNLSGEFDKSLCQLDVRSGQAEMVELGADCDNCSCELCEPYCTP